MGSEAMAQLHLHNCTSEAIILTYLIDQSTNYI